VKEIKKGHKRPVIFRNEIRICHMEIQISGMLHLPKVL
jgi:hypothetical protein